MNSNKKNLILIHGWSAHGNYFSSARKNLQKQFNVYTPDLPGHGNNQETPDSISDLAEWLQEYIQKQEIYNPILAGWSMGAMVAMETVRLYGDQHIDGLAIIDMTPRLLHAKDWNHGLRGEFTERDNQKNLDAIITDWRAFCISATSSFFAKDSNLKIQLDWTSNQILNNNPMVMQRLWHSMSQQDYRALLPYITIPTLILMGARSQLYTAATGQYLKDNIMNARLQVLHQSGHSPHMEEPEAFCDAIECYFLSEA